MLSGRGGEGWLRHIAPRSYGIQQAESSDRLYWLGAALAMISNVTLLQGPYKIISVLSSELVSSARDTQRVNPNTTGYVLHRRNTSSLTHR